MARWFTPQTAECSCECSGLPPIFACGCPVGPCTPVGTQQFSGLRTVITSTDAMVCVSELTNYPNCNLSGNPCWKEPRIHRSTQQISGLAGFNGTYDATYVELDGAEYIESDPVANPCGFWFFPFVEATLSWSGNTEFIYPTACLSDTSSPTSGSGTVAMSTANGALLTTSPYATPAWPRLGVLSPSFYISSMPFTWTRTFTKGYFNCQDGSTPDAVQEDEIAISGDSGISDVDSMDLHIGAIAAPEGLSVGLPTIVGTATYDGIFGQLISWHTGTAQCVLQFESILHDIPAYNQTQLSATYNCGLFPTVVAQNTHKLNFNAFQRTITYTLNV